MRTQEGSGPRSALFTRQGLPVFGTFLIWGTGGGAQALGMALFGYMLTRSAFLVTVMFAILGVARVISGPLAGYLTDHWGRKPVSTLGSMARGTASLMIIFIDDSFIAFIFLELLGFTGSTLWQTTTQVMVADMSSPENRGRAVASRVTALRLGQILGPVLGGGAAAVWGLRAVFFINAGAKFMVTLITLRLIRETRPEPKAKPSTGRTPRPSVSILSLVATRDFLVLGITTFSVSLMALGIFHSLFLIAAQEVAGLDEGQIGALLAITGTVTLLGALPNGVIIDRFGRKPMLVPGLVLTGVASVLIAIGDDFNGLLLAVSVFGFAQAMTQGTTQTFAMDLAPEDQRGTFLGVWSAVQSLGASAGPLGAGIIVELWGFATAFMAIAVLFGITAFVMAVYGPETYHRGQQSPAK